MLFNDNDDDDYDDEHDDDNDDDALITTFINQINIFL